MTIQELRKRVNMSQSEFAKYTEIPLRTIQKWERGGSVPPSYIPRLIERVIELEGQKNEA